MEKTLSNLKTYQAFFEDLTDHSYAPAEKEIPVETEKKVEKPEEVNKTTEAKPDAEKSKPVKEEEEQSTGLTKTLEKCIENVEEIVNLFEKDDQKLIDIALPILDLCQTNLNFQEKKSPGTASLLETSKKIIKELVEKLKKEYPNNDPVSELIDNCNRL